MLDSRHTPHLQVNNSKRAVRSREFWRPFWVMFMVGLLTAFLCEVILEAPIKPISVIILGGSAAFALLVWRAFLLSVLLRKRTIHG